MTAVGPRAAYLELLAERPDLLANLVTLCARGEALTGLLIVQPELLGQLAGPTVSRRPRRKADFRRVLAEALAPGLGLAERKGFLADYKRRTADVRAIYAQVFSGSSSIPSVPSSA